MQQQAQHLPWWGWAAFAAVVAVLLAIDLVMTTGERAESRRWALGWSVVWVGMGLAFIAVPWLLIGGQAAMEYLTVYLLEKSLSLDNLFVFLVIFGSLGLAKRFQHKVLFWGILGAVVFRGIFIFAGAAALDRFHWIIYVFAAILLFAAWQTFREDPARKSENKTLSWLSRRLPVSQDDHGGRFIARQDGKLVL